MAGVVAYRAGRRCACDRRRPGPSRCHARRSVAVQDPRSRLRRALGCRPCGRCDSTAERRRGTPPRRLRPAFHAAGDVAHRRRRRAFNSDIGAGGRGVVSAHLAQLRYRRTGGVPRQSLRDGFERVALSSRRSPSPPSAAPRNRSKRQAAPRLVSAFLCTAWPTLLAQHQ